MALKIEELFFQHYGNQIDKWEQYVKIYDIEFSRFAQSERPIDLLEIGVQNGGSLELWSAYLPPGSEIHGVDIDPNVTQIKLSQPNIHIYVADGTTDKMLDLFSSKMFDIVIDDGSHISSDIIKSFSRCFQLVKPGGLYIIEDLHSAYYKSHGGGVHENKSAMNYLKKLVDAMHLDYIDNDLISSDRELSALRRYNRLIGRVTFYDSMAVIEKLARPKVAPYRRIVSGTTHDTVGSSQWLNALPRPQLATLCLSSKAAEQIDHRLVTKIEQLEDKEIILSQAKMTLSEKIAGLEMELQNLNKSHSAYLDKQIELSLDEAAKRQSRIEALETALQDSETRHSLALERQAELSRDEVANRQARIEALETALQDLDARHTFVLEEKTKFLREELLDQQDRINLLKLELNNYAVKFEELDKIKASAVEKIHNADNHIINLRLQLDQEKNDANRIIVELRGKLDRAYAAWASKKVAIERLKSGRLSSGR